MSNSAAAHERHTHTYKQWVLRLNGIGKANSLFLQCTSVVPHGIKVSYYLQKIYIAWAYILKHIELWLGCRKSMFFNGQNRIPLVLDVRHLHVTKVWSLTEMHSCESGLGNKWELFFEPHAACRLKTLFFRLVIDVVGLAVCLSPDGRGSDKQIKPKEVFSNIVVTEYIIRFECTRSVFSLFVLFDQDHTTNVRQGKLSRI